MANMFANSWGLICMSHIRPLMLWIFCCQDNVQKNILLAHNTQLKTVQKSSLAINAVTTGS